MSEASLSSRLRDATHAMHRIAETSQFMRKMLKGQLPAPAFCIFLRNLHPLYEVLESELDRLASTEPLGTIRISALYRTAALAQDLDRLHGSGWQALPVALAMEQYICRIRELASQHPALLAAHAYVRYMGDLSGGQILGDIINRAFALPERVGMAFYRFDDDPMILKAGFRTMLDELRVNAATADEIVIEANRSFEYHVKLFDELDRSTATNH